MDALGVSEAEDGAGDHAGEDGEEEFGSACEPVDADDDEVDGGPAEGTGEEDGMSPFHGFLDAPDREFGEEVGGDEAEKALGEGDLDAGGEAVIPVDIEAPTQEEGHGEEAHR